MIDPKAAVEEVGRGRRVQGRWCEIRVRSRATGPDRCFAGRVVVSSFSSDGTRGFRVRVESFGAAAVERRCCCCRFDPRGAAPGMRGMGNCVGAGACGRDERRRVGEGPA